MHRISADLSFIVTIVLFFFSPGLIAQEEPTPEQLVEVGEVNWNIAVKEGWKAGITREPALRKYYRLNVGDQFETAMELERKVEAITRDLNTQQIYSEITYEIEYIHDDTFPFGASMTGRKEDILIAHITISVTDAFSLYLLPYVLYDSNLGTVFGGSFSYNNVLGTLTNLNLEGYGGQDTWRVGGLWENVPFGPMRCDLSLYNELITTRRVDDNDNTVLEYTHLQLDFYMELNIPLSRGFVLSIQPGAYLPYFYELVSYDSSYGRSEFDNLIPLTSGFLREGVSYSNVFWEERFRRGLEADIFLTGEGPGDEGNLQFSLDGSASYFYRTPLSFVGVGHHISAFHVFYDSRENCAQYIRGVLDHLMYGDTGVFLNNNIDIRAFAIRPLLEIHLYPLVDLGFVYNHFSPFDPLDFRVTTGFGVTLFPLFLQSLQLNIEAGFDLSQNGRSEVTFKSELFF